MTNVPSSDQHIDYSMDCLRSAIRQFCRRHLILTISRNRVRSREKKAIGIALYLFANEEKNIILEQALALC